MRCSRASWCICAEQARGVPGDRHPCRRRPLRSARPGGDPQSRNGATASRGSGRADRRRGRARCSRPISTSSRALNPAGELATYPGSPALAARAACAARTASSPASSSRPRRPRSRHNLGGDRRAKAVAIDGWTALNAYVPPPERRGVVLIDPPFEAMDEFSAARPGARSRPPQMGDRHLSALVSDQGPAGSRCAGAAFAAVGDPEGAARRSRFRTAARAGTPRRLRADRGQSALDAGRRTRDPGCRSSPRFSRAAIASTGSRAGNNRQPENARL